MGEHLHIHGRWILFRCSVGGRAASSLQMQMLQVFMGKQCIHGRCDQLVGEQQVNCRCCKCSWESSGFMGDVSSVHGRVEIGSTFVGWKMNLRAHTLTSVTISVMYNEYAIFFKGVLHNLL